MNSPGSSVGPIAYVTTVASSLRGLLLPQMLDLRAAGYDVVTISAPGPEVPLLERHGFRHIAVPMTRRMTPLQDLRSLFDLVRVFRCERFCLVHTHTPKANLLGQWAACLARVPIRVSTVHGFYFTRETPGLQRWGRQWVERLSALPAHRVFLINQDDEQAARDWRICRPSQVCRLPAGLGIDTRRFDRSAVREETLASLRREFSLPAGARVVGFIGRLVREKGILDLLAAARIVHAQAPDVRFLFVGPVDAEKPDAVTPALAESYGLKDVCVFTGERYDTPEWLALMDVFVLPSYREGMPLSPMEASSMGVPCVVTDIRGSREIVRDGVNGFAVPIRNPEALAQTLLRILSDPALAARLREGGRALALKAFDQSISFDIVRRVYERLIQNHVQDG